VLSGGADVEASSAFAEQTLSLDASEPAVVRVLGPWGSTRGAIRVGSSAVNPECSVP
jgi:hypothetical protein